MKPLILGSRLSAQTRYAAGTCEILECYFEGASGGSEVVAKFKEGLRGLGLQSTTEASGFDAFRAHA